MEPTDEYFEHFRETVRRWKTEGRIQHAHYCLLMQADAVDDRGMSANILLAVDRDEPERSIRKIRAPLNKVQ